MRIFLLGLALVGVLFGLLLAGMMAYSGRDIPAPDVADLVLDRPEVTPEHNGYTYLVAATNAMYQPTNAMLVTDYLDGKTVDDAAVDEVIARNAETFRLVGEAVRCGICLPPEVTGFDALLPYVATWRSLGRLQALKARHDRLAGNYAGATDACITLLRFGDLIQKDSGCIINYLVGVAVLDLGLRQAEDLARDDGVPLGELRRLGEELAALRPSDLGLICAVKGEYKLATGFVDQIRDGKMGTGSPAVAGMRRPLWSRRLVVGYFFQPNRTKLTFAEFYRAIIRDAPRCYAGMERPDVKAENGADTGHMGLLVRPNGIGNMFCGMLLPALGEILERKCRMECHIAATRLVVALNTYQAKESRLPDDLQALVPVWLSSVPNDPYDGKPFRYSSSQGMIYSVGRDLKDSGGSSKPAEGKRAHHGWTNQWDLEDYVFRVEGESEPAPTAEPPKPEA